MIPERRLAPAGGADTRRERTYVGEDGVDEAGLCLAVRIEVESQAIDQSGADRRGIGGPGDLGGMCRSFDAKAHCDRQFGKPA